MKCKLLYCLEASHKLKTMSIEKGELRHKLLKNKSSEFENGKVNLKKVIKILNS